MRKTKQPAVADIADIIHDFRVCHEESTQGLWIRGRTTHETVAVQVEKEPYHVAHFRHANDAQFCDVAHAHALRLCDELEKAHARIAELEAELVVEAKKTASEKLRADQMTEQHRMQAKMHAEASEQVVRLKTQLGGAFSTSHDPGPAAIATLQGMGYEHRGGVQWAPPVGKVPEWIASEPPATPWYPDDSGEWAEVPNGPFTKPAGIPDWQELEVLSNEERQHRKWKSCPERADSWEWGYDYDHDCRIVAYKVVKP